ncbi:MAG: GTPase Era [Bacteroidia bacterium]|nr:GTPase Era [Bacteroidia bacterium]MCF8427299.1 GTPase Era [Bacteroidia bacterium]
MSFQSGFVSIIGKPNVGKSTLLNALLGEKLSIISQKAQTTRHRIKGILNNPNYQIVFSDTPGIINPKYKLQGSMMKFVNESLVDSDLVIFMCDFDERNEEQELFERLKMIKLPMVCLLNKIDGVNQEQLMAKINFWNDMKLFKEIIPVSALNKFNIDVLLKSILTYLPEGAPYYDQDQLTDKSERFVASEIIREKIMVRYKEEIPYSVQVEIESFKEEKDIIHIHALLYVMRDSQKQILIGRGGIALKNVGIAARRDMEHFFKKKIFLKTFVKVKEDWRDDTKTLREFGYEGE